MYEHRFCAGDRVAVVDARQKFHGMTGVVQYFVADNIYVKFEDVRWAPTRMFFPDQIRFVEAPQTNRAIAKPSVFVRGLRVLRQRMRLF